MIVAAFVIGSDECHSQHCTLISLAGGASSRDTTLKTRCDAPRRLEVRVQYRIVSLAHAFKSMWSCVAFQSRPTARALSDSSWNALWQQVCLDFSACVPHSELSHGALNLISVRQRPGLHASSPLRSHRSSSVSICPCVLHAALLSERQPHQKRLACSAMVFTAGFTHSGYRPSTVQRYQGAP